MPIGAGALSRDLISRGRQNINNRQGRGKDDDSMRKILMLLVLATLAACQSGKVYVGGEGEYYQGIVAPR